MKVLIIGGSGFIGTALSKKLVELGHDVSVIDKRDSNVENISFIKCDRSHHIEFTEKTLNENYEIVFDLCCNTVNLLKSTLEVFNGKIEHYILTSTVSVYDFNKIMTLPIHENSRLKKDSTSEYGTEKAICEEVLQDTNVDFNYTIIRPCYIYGEQCQDNRIEYMIDRMIDQRDLIIFNPLEIVLQFIYIEDLVDAFVKIMKNKSTYGEVFNVCSDECISLKKLLNILASYDKRTFQVIDENQLKCNVGDELNDTFYLNKVYNFPIFFDNSKLKTALDWRPNTSLYQGMENVYQYRKKYLKINPNNYENEDMIFKCLNKM